MIEIEDWYPEVKLVLAKEIVSDTVGKSKTFLWWVVTKIQEIFKTYVQKDIVLLMKVA